MTNETDSSSTLQPIVFGSVLILLCVVSLIVNGMTCCIIRWSRRLQSTTNYFILSLCCLAMLNSMVTLLLVPDLMQSLQWPLGDISCRIVAWLVQCCCNINSFVLIYISVDRFYAIKFPLKFKITRGKAKRLIIIGWICGLNIGLPELYFYSQQIELSSSGEVIYRSCMIQQTDLFHKYLALGFHAPLAVVVCLLPGLVILITYLRISKYIWTIGKKPVRFRRTQHPVARNKIKVLKLLFCITLIDFVCCGAYYVLVLMALFYYQHFYFILSSLFIFLMNLVKPFMFITLNGTFRRALKEIFCWHHQSLYRQEAYSTITAFPVAKRNYVGLMPLPLGESSNNSSGNISGNQTQIQKPIHFEKKGSEFHENLGNFGISQRPSIFTVQQN